MPWGTKESTNQNTYVWGKHKHFHGWFMKKYLQSSDPLIFLDPPLYFIHKFITSTNYIVYY